MLATSNLHFSLPNTNLPFELCVITGIRDVYEGITRHILGWEYYVTLEPGARATCDVDTVMSHTRHSRFFSEQHQGQTHLC